jgi:hypothetical protein
VRVAEGVADGGKFSFSDFGGFRLGGVMSRLTLSANTVRELSRSGERFVVELDMRSGGSRMGKELIRVGGLSFSSVVS